MIAQVEGAAALARRAQRAADKQLNPKGSKRLKPAALAAASRVYARDAALDRNEAVRLVGGADGQLGELEQRLGLASIHHAQGGRLADLSRSRRPSMGACGPDPERLDKRAEPR